MGVGLYRLAHGATYSMIASHLGLGEWTARYICDEFNTAVVTHLQPKYIGFPTGDRLQFELIHCEFTMNKFLANHNMHMCVGAKDGSHIPIIAPHLYPEVFAVSSFFVRTNRIDLSSVSCT